MFPGSYEAMIHICLVCLIFAHVLNIITLHYIANLICAAIIKAPENDFYTATSIVRTQELQPVFVEQNSYCNSL